MIVELDSNNFHLIQPLLNKDTERDSLLIQSRYQRYEPRAYLCR